MDFLQRLRADAQARVDNNGFKLVQNINTDEESISFAALPGGTVQRTYYDGTRDKSLNYEIRGRSQRPKEAEDTLNQLSEYLQDLTQLDSADKSFSFIDINVTDEPYFLEADNDAYFDFGLGFTARLTIYPKEGTNV